MILNASAENFSSSSALRRSTGSSSSSSARDRRDVDRRRQVVDHARRACACTPLFLNAVPHSIGIDFAGDRALAQMP